MLAWIVTAALALLPQQPRHSRHTSPDELAAAVAVQGAPELTAAAALASAQVRVEEHVRTVWQRRAERTAAMRRPFWLPSMVMDAAVQSWLVDLPARRWVRLVDREDRERQHEFGSSYQTTLWVAEDPSIVEEGERRLVRELRRIERAAVAKVGAVVGGWLLLYLLLGWLDRLSRGYMTRRLWALGLLGGAVLPAVAVLV